MKEINIAAVLADKRREKGITQEDLARYIGVSKASVSKWETAQSYPDITLLPLLATFFNISIDELMGYTAQMSKEDINELYKKLSFRFATESFPNVLADCKKIINKYYSCFPLLLKMSILLINHYMMDENSEKQKAILGEAVELCFRIEKESEDVWLSKEAVTIRAFCYLLLQQPQDALELLGETIRPISMDEGIMAQSYQMLGNTAKAEEVIQIQMYQHLMALIGSVPMYLLLNENDEKKVDEILRRSMALKEIFDLDKLHPNTMAQIYFAAAQTYSNNKKYEEALEMLQKYTDLCTKNFFPYSLHGDIFFNKIDGWLEEFDLGNSSPRNEKVIKESMLQSVESNPAFRVLEEYPKYKNILELLRQNNKS
ncbi:helix-turn-helix domain-containing protein [Anaeromicropila populeti]|uniref:DNA-binding transcriptional regulator, XRE-family HTH domain n=1 Tax=Anaeromicropila populeti TaxID=37658 RepID=A0A1I6JCI9_9FIRM|nr:helix-turn-helix transcriptional regulator [Anaeromicropila populeti]SFR76735.1 DNA-binding transcriptional regulator, XRE-family HTH domain [Anaeromicropila populeti]